MCVVAAVLGMWHLTRNGWANTYYSEAAQAATRSWTAWLTNALDVSGNVSLDKGPLPNIVLGLSGRVFGLSSFGVLFPSVLVTVGTVLLLHNTVKRTLGPRIALLAAAALALTPVTVVMSRFNNPDPLLVLSEIAGAWAMVRTLESDRTRHVALCGLFIGLAFNTKMLQAYLVVPALAVALLIAGQGTIWRRGSQLAVGGAAMVASSFAWYGTMMLIPASHRPWVGDTTDNSWFSLIFGANGLSRVAGNGSSTLGGGGGFGGASGPFRMFDAAVGGQIAWLLPLSLLGLGLGLWSRRGAPRADKARAAYLLWGAWALVTSGVFSFSSGIFHPYYTAALAPASSVLAAAALVIMWRAARGSARWAATLAIALMATAALAALLLGRASGFVPWLAPSIVVAALVAAVALVVRNRWLAAVAGSIAVLAGPVAFSVATVAQVTAGQGNPLAGPVGAADRGRFGPARDQSSQRSLIYYLQAHRAGAKYLVAASGSVSAGSIALASGANVLNMGGFMGQDPAPTRRQLQHLIATGQLRYVMPGSAPAPAPVPGGPGGPGGGDRPPPPGRFPLSGPVGGPPLSGAFPGGGPPLGRFPGGAALTSHREAWVKRTCTAVSGFSGLYECTRAGSGRSRPSRKSNVSG